MHVQYYKQTNWQIQNTLHLWPREDNKKLVQMIPSWSIRNYKTPSLVVKGCVVYSETYLESPGGWTLQQGEEDDSQV